MTGCLTLISQQSVMKYDRLLHANAAKTLTAVAFTWIITTSCVNHVGKLTRDRKLLAIRISYIFLCFSLLPSLQWIKLYTEYSVITILCKYPTYDYIKEMTNYHISQHGTNKDCFVDVSFEFCERMFWCWLTVELLSHVITVVNVVRLVMKRCNLAGHSSSWAHTAAAAELISLSAAEAVPH